MATSCRGGTDPDDVVRTARVDQSRMVVPPIAVAIRTFAAAGACGSAAAAGDGLGGGGTFGTAAGLA
jgi:hypothetical protein